MQKSRVDPDQIKEPSWWGNVSTAPEANLFIAFDHVKAGITPDDAAFLVRVVQQRNGQELRRATIILVEMLRGRFPAVMPGRETIARAMLALAGDGYPENERARAALSVLTFADREAASQFVQNFKLARSTPTEYRKEIAEQLNTINTDASFARLDQFLAAQHDPELRASITRPSSRYVAIEELGRRWQKDHDIVVLNRLTSEWIDHIYEGYPLDEVIAVMGEPQRSGEREVFYSSKQGPELYLEVNHSRQIGGRDGPR